MVLVGIFDVNENKEEALNGLVAHLQKLLRLPLKEATLLHDVNGAPYLDGNLAYVSLSDSCDVRVIAVSDNKVGVDIEKIREVDFKKFATRFGFTTSSKEEFFQKFTSSEATFKLQGGNLFSTLKSADDLKVTRLPYIKGYELCIATEKEETVFICNGK